MYKDLLKCLKIDLCVMIECKQMLFTFQHGLPCRIISSAFS